MAQVRRQELYIFQKLREYPKGEARIILASWQPYAKYMVVSDGSNKKEL